VEKRGWGNWEVVAERGELWKVMVLKVEERWVGCHWVCARGAMVRCKTATFLCPCLCVDLQRRSSTTPERKRGVSFLFAGSLGEAGSQCSSCLPLAFVFSFLAVLLFTKVSYFLFIFSLFFFTPSMPPTYYDSNFIFVNIHTYSSIYYVSNK